MKKKKEKMFIVQKHVMAANAAAALRKEKKQGADEVYIDEKWRASNKDRLADAIGFGVEHTEKEHGTDD